jgi:methyl-accepting chemotaxis protein
LKALTEGDMTVKVDGVDRRDEIGRVAESAQAFKETLLRARRLEDEAREKEERDREERRASVLEMADRFEWRVGAVVDGVSGAADELQATARYLASAVDEANAQCAAVAAASDQASGNVQTVASSAEELSSAIGEVSQQVGGASSRARGVAEGARGARAELDALAAAIGDVDEIVEGINEVADKTNLLALNATIEAARAGEAGRGFAIVASEVKGLAKQTREMTERIGARIGSVKASSERSLSAMRGIIEQVGDIDETVASMAASVEEQSAATGEISRNAQEAATGTHEVSRNIAHVQEASTETGESANNLREAADQLAANAARLKHEMGALLHEIRAA